MGENATIEIPSAAIETSAPSSKSPEIDVTHWEKTGEYQAPESTKPAESSPAKPTIAEPSPAASKGPDDAPGKDDVEPKPEDPRNLRSQLKRANARAEQLERELAESRRPAPETRKEETVSPATAATKAPRLKDYAGTEEGVEQWQAATEAYYVKLAEDRIEARFGRERTQAEVWKIAESWDSQVKAATADTVNFKDFETIADDAVISAAGLEIIKSHPHGAAVLYYLGLPENAELANSIFADTDIDGLDYAALVKAQANPQIKARTLQALGYARAKFNDIAASLSKKAPTTETPLKEVIRAKPRPSAEAGRGGTGSVSGDPLTQAYKDGNFEEIDRLETEALRSRGRR